MHFAEAIILVVLAKREAERDTVLRVHVVTSLGNENDFH
jgi:hypothetical protein